MLSGYYTLFLGFILEAIMLHASQTPFFSYRRLQKFKILLIARQFRVIYVGLDFASAFSVLIFTMFKTDLRPSSKEKLKGSVNFSALAIEFALLIGIPLLALILLGIWLDKTMGTTPVFIIISFLLALVCSTVLMYKKIQMLFAQLESTSKSSPENKPR